VRASHDLSRVSTSFDEHNLVPNAGLLPAAVLAQRIDGSTKLTGQSGFLGCFPSVLAGAGPAYASSLVDGVAEPEGVASFVFGEPVVALRPRVRVPGLQACQDGRPPRVDGRGEAVDLGCAGRRGVVVE